MTERLRVLKVCVDFSNPPFHSVLVNAASLRVSAADESAIFLCSSCLRLLGGSAAVATALVRLFVSVLISGT